MATLGGVGDQCESPTKSKWQLSTKKNNFKKNIKKRPKLMIRIALKELKNIFTVVKAEKRNLDYKIQNEKPPSGRGLRWLVVEFVNATLRQLGIFISLSK